MLQSFIQKGFFQAAMIKVSKKNYIIADFGASNGRVGVGTYSGNKFEIETLHRFENRQVLLNGRYFWDILKLFSELKNGISKAFNKYGNIRSVAVDTWGLDFGLIDKSGKLISNPLTYRDPDKSIRFPGNLFKIITQEEFYELTGYFASPLAPAFYLEKLTSEKSYELENTHKFLPLSDLFNYFLTGNFAIEYSMACGTLLVNCRTKTWEDKIIANSGFSKSILSDIIDPGVKIGNISLELCNEMDIKSFSVASAVGHDTASAIAGIPSDSNEAAPAFLSTGTWLVLGIETENPIINFDSLRHMFGNEGGVLKRNFFARNLTGFWIMQQCVDKWQRLNGSRISWGEIDESYSKTQPFLTLINTEALVFQQNHDDMPGVIRNYCSQNKLPVPQSAGEISRCIYESLVMAVKHYFELLVKYYGKKINKLYIIGGGVNNRLFCQWLSNALQVEIIAGPVEASSVGNMLMQLMADNEIRNIGEGRLLSIGSSQLVAYEPSDCDLWESKYKEYASFFNFEEQAH
jgi:rhamnulokinase